jgi:hypothetical protein
VPDAAAGRFCRDHIKGKSGADEQTRTADLRITKE